MKNFYAPLLALLIVIVISCEKETIQSLESENLIVTEAKAAKKEQSEHILIGCETSFATSNDNLSSCFTGDGFNRWGWSVGPLSSGDYHFDIYAAAGQCDISKGNLAGTLEVSYNANTGTATVNYNANSGYGFTETHLYIGNEPYPMVKRGKKLKATVAPGQYPFQNTDLDKVSSDSYTVENLSGEIYIIAHAVVCDAPENNGEDNPDNGDTGDNPETGGEETCNDCLGDVTDLNLLYFGGQEGVVEVIESDGTVIFSSSLAPFEQFSISGTNSDGSFGPGIEIFVDGVSNAVFATDCSEAIAPGVPSGSFVVNSGRSTEGGELCPIDIF